MHNYLKTNLVLTKREKQSLTWPEYDTLLLKAPKEHGTLIEIHPGKGFWFIKIHFWISGFIGKSEIQNPNPDFSIESTLCVTLKLITGSLLAPVLSDFIGTTQNKYSLAVSLLT